MKKLSMRKTPTAVTFIFGDGSLRTVDERDFRRVAGTEVQNSGVIMAGWLSGVGESAKDAAASATSWQEAKSAVIGRLVTILEGMSWVSSGRVGMSFELVAEAIRRIGAAKNTPAEKIEAFIAKVEGFDAAQLKALVETRKDVAAMVAAVKKERAAIATEVEEPFEF